jgi:4-hydroxy-3-methylbut-2-enyl diphosphate reductase
MEVKTAPLGWCVGIERAYRLMNTQASLAAGKPLYATHQCTTPHTNDDVDTLRRIEQGDERLLARYPALKDVQVLHDLSGLQGDHTLLLGFHGLPHDTIATLHETGVEIKDYKCPFIAKLDDTVDRLVAEGFDILIMGKPKNHHCMYAQEVAAQHQRQCLVIETLEDLDTVPRQPPARWALVGQVTGNILLWQRLVERVQQGALAAHVVQTVCSDSYKRQDGAMQLARKTDCCVIVDDAGGASQSLFEVLSTMPTRVHRLRWRDDGSWQAALDPGWFTEARSVAVVGGILIPQWAIDAVAAYLRDLA